MKMIVSLLACLVSISASAASVHTCDGLDSIGNLIGNTRSIGANGEVKIAYVSTEEPAAAPDHLLVFVYGEEMSVDCFAISQTEDGLGFSSVGFDKIKSSYDAGKGILLTVPVTTYDHETGTSKSIAPVKVRINQANGVKVTIE